MTDSVRPAEGRIDWVDYAKGICIFLVVLMHSTLGTEKAVEQVSWLHPFIEWARPFRMPDFFLISGLFLAFRIDWPWRRYIDAKVLHFAYFYVLWMNILFVARLVFQGSGDSADFLIHTYWLGYIEPYGSLWFIYILAVFFVVTKLLCNVSPWLVLLVAALLEMAPIHTGWIVIDEFAGRYVYFFSGYWLASQIFRFASIAAIRLSTHSLLVGLFLWAVFNEIMVAKGLDVLPVFSLALGYVGAAAVIAMGVLLSRFRWAGWIGYCGQKSLIIYLAFGLFMAPARSLFLKSSLGANLGLTSIAVATTAFILPLCLYWLLRATPLSCLFQRPAAFRLSPTRHGWHSGEHDPHTKLKARRPSLSR